MGTEYVLRTTTQSDDWPKGGMCIGKGMWEFIRAYLPDGSSILELGAGWGTQKLAENYKVYSIEDNIDWVTPYQNVADVVHAPIKKYDEEYTIPVTNIYFDPNKQSLPDTLWRDITNEKAIELLSIFKKDNELPVPVYPGDIGWYNPDIVQNFLSDKKYDIIIVDGPNGFTGRGGFFKHIDMFDTDKLIIIDDFYGQRPETVLTPTLIGKLGRDYISVKEKSSGDHGVIIPPQGVDTQEFYNKYSDYLDKINPKPSYV